MTTEQAKEYIYNNLDTLDKILTRCKKPTMSNGGREFPNYICPICSNGRGKDGTGLSLAGNTFTCFGCSFKGSVFDLIAEKKGLVRGSKQAFDETYKIWGIDVDEYSNNSSKPKNKPEKVEYTDYADFVREYCKPDANHDYVNSRGISEETARRLMFGYNPKYNSLIIPETYNGRFTYEWRRINNADEKNKRYGKAVNGGKGWFNEDAIKQTEKPVFVVEGAMDCASIEELGFKAVAICSVNNIDDFIKYLEKNKISGIKFICALDNDEAGQKANERLKNGLILSKFEIDELTYPENIKDANDWLKADKEGMRAKLQEAIDNFIPLQDTEDINENSVCALMPKLNEYIAEQREHDIIPTGFQYLDEYIGGGLYPKLYTITAMPSIGKTTFVLQMADNIAKAKNDVIIFSLEMGWETIMARSISRYTYQINSQLAKTENGILNGNWWGNYSQEEIDVINQAQAQYYKDCGKNISIHSGPHTATEIYSKVERYIEKTRKRPVVIVDYLQLITPEEKGERRDTVDYSIEQLNRIKRELKCPVIVICSTARGNYSKEMDMSSAKESGEIEYTADCVINMIYDIDYTKWVTIKNSSGEKQLIDKTQAEIRADIKKMCRNSPIKIRLSLAKNRGARKGLDVCFRYYPEYNYFVEDVTQTTVYNGKE